MCLNRNTKAKMYQTYHSGYIAWWKKNQLMYKINRELVQSTTIFPSVLTVQGENELRNKIKK